ncbi:WD40 repeat domain-containing protein [Sulfurospirillum sp.]|uniref:WD40 repeat domain-containing protein n=1 Tax=Sulfurospirillum sp. TaxID=2053622 RepID=UPI002FDEC12B
MLPSSREITFHSAISYASVADESTLQIIDNQAYLHTIDLNQIRINQNMPLCNTYTHTLFDYYKRPFSVGNHLAYISFAKNNIENVIDTRFDSNPVSTFHFNKNEIVSKAAFSENDQFLITGNERGRSYIISPEDGIIQSELPITSDVISAVAISEEYKRAAYASFSHELVVYKINSFSIAFEQKLDDVIEMMTFLDEETLLAITRGGKVIKIDLMRGKVILEKVLDHNVWPSVMVLSHSKKFIYIGTRESILFAVYVKTLDILYHVKLPYDGVTTLSRTQKYFIMGFKTGELLFYNHREFEEQFITYIKLKKIKEACLIFQKNIFLMSHRETKKIYEYWLEEKETIVNLLSRGDIAQAQKIAEPFLFHPKCKLEFKEIEELQPDIMALHRYIRSIKYVPAYDLVKLKPELRQSSLFSQLESLWNKNLQKAQILLAREPLLNKDVAQESLRDFLDVEEKKPIIENMLKRSGIFTMAENSVKEKNFNFYFRLVAQNIFLESTPLYQKVLQVAERLQHEIVKYLEEKNYKQALILSDILHQFKPYQNQANRLKEVSKALLILEHQVTHKMLFEAVRTQDQFQLQSHYALVEELEEMKKSFHTQQMVLINAKEYAKVYSNIEPYMQIAICKQNVSNIIRKMYIAQLQDAQHERNETVDWEKSFLTYLKFFPMDKLLVEFAKEHQKLDVLQRIVISSPPPLNPLYPKNLVTGSSIVTKKMS